MIRAMAKAKAKAIAEFKMGEAGTTLDECKIHESKFYYGGDWHTANIYDRKKLHQGLQVAGPAIIGEMDSTTVVLPGYIAAIDAIGNLLINPALGGDSL